MERDLEIQKIAKRIQKDIDKLKDLDCAVDFSEHAISVFDNKIKPIKSLSADGCDYSNTILFSFNTHRK